MKPVSITTLVYLVLRKGGTYTPMWKNTFLSQARDEINSYVRTEV